MISYYVYFPVAWRFEPHPSDGIGGPPVSDAGTIYVYSCRGDFGPEKVLLKTTLQKVIDEVIEGAQHLDGNIPPATNENIVALHAALQAAADSLKKRLV